MYLTTLIVDECESFLNVHDTNTYQVWKKKKTIDTRTNLVRSKINNNTTLVPSYQSLPIYNHTSMMYIFVIHVEICFTICPNFNSRLHGNILMPLSSNYITFC